MTRSAAHANFRCLLPYARRALLEGYGIAFDIAVARWAALAFDALWQNEEFQQDLADKRSVDGVLSIWL